ncbi:threonyl-tRNA synthetase [Klebsiella pneumoniae]|uniref:Threonyl-tRNA synthetase n=1 Tax=Klebsiella pneumoniae TaxID=573 RepID=A0A377TUJ8_KLEPN|nr:threonyl-tRNA synthetase [Klebsiella pneumoniae]
MVYDMYSTFGFEKIVVKLSTRPEKRIGSDETWDRAEADLAVALEENNIPFEYQLGEGAFYGRKLNLPCMTASIVHGSAVPYSWTSLCRSV